MKSSYPQAVVQDALQRLDAQDVLEFIDYRPESMQKSGDTIRCFCPIHHDGSQRSLTVDLANRTFKCADPVCPGSVGGNLIELYAHARSITFDEAIANLADEFGFMLLKAGTDDEVEAALAEADEFAARATREKGKAVSLRAEAEKRYRGVLTARPDHERALRGLADILRANDNVLELGTVVTRLIELGARSGASEDALAAARAYLELNPTDLRIQRQLAELLMAAGATDEAVSEYMKLADSAEQTQQYELALLAYRKIADVNTAAIDVHPMIVHLLSTLNRPADAVAEIVKRAMKSKDAGEFREAAAILQTALEIQPENPAIRLDTIRLLCCGTLDADATAECLAQADALADANQLAAAVEGLEALDNANPMQLPVVERLSSLYRRVGRIAEAREAEFLLARMYRDAENFDSALLLLEQLIVHGPEDVPILAEIAELHLAQGEDGREAGLDALDEARKLAVASGDLQSAVGFARRAAELDPANMERQSQYVHLLQQGGEQHESKTAVQRLCENFEKAGNDVGLAEALRLRVQLEPGEPRHLIDFAETLQRLGRTGEALDARFRAAALHESAGQQHHAEAQLRMLLEDAPDHLEALRSLIRVLQAQSKVRDARAARLRLADVLVARQDALGARAIMQAMLHEEPDDLELLGKASDLATVLGDEKGVVDCSLKIAAIHLEARRLKEAREQLDQILELDSENIPALTMLADLHDRADDKPKAVAAILRKARIAQERNDREAEREALTALLQRDPKNADALERMAVLAYEANERSEAGARLEEFTSSAPPSRALAALRELLLRYPEDLALHGRYVALVRKHGSKEDLAAALQSVIALHEKADRWRDAVALYREVLLVTPDSAYLRTSLVEALKRLGDRAGAANESIKLAELYARQGSNDEAMEAYQQVLRLDPADERAVRGQVKLLLAAGRTDAATERLRALSDAFASQGKREDAVRVLRSISEFDPDNPDVRRALVSRLTEEGNTEDAVSELLVIADMQLATEDVDGMISTLREAVAIAPADQSLRRRLISALDDSGRVHDAIGESIALAESLQGTDAEGALRVLDDVLRKHPENLRSRRLRAELYLAAGDEKKAIAEYRQMAPYLDRVGGNGAGAPVPTGANRLKLMPEYDFDSFVVGTRNNFAYATAKAIAKAPGTAYNPLFLYSDVGLGKTHLLHAIANYMLAHYPNTRITYTNSEDFTAELVEAIENNTVAAFRQHHKSADILLLDDVQFLAGKERSQEELFHIFNNLFQAKKQIVVTSDRPPKDIAHLEKRLKSRFGAGVVVDIQPPDVETRVAILKREMQLRRTKVEVPDEVLQGLAERIESNVRDLKGALNQIIIAGELGGQKPTVDAMNQVVDRLYATR